MVYGGYFFMDSMVSSMIWVNFYGLANDIHLLYIMYSLYMVKRSQTWIL